MIGDGINAAPALTLADTVKEPKSAVITAGYKVTSIK